MEEIDAVDNGVAQTDGEPRYALTTHLSARVGRLNPRWNDPKQDTEVRMRGHEGVGATGMNSSGLTPPPLCVPRRGSSGRWSWWGANSWTGWIITTGPGCPRGRSWRRPSGGALRCSRGWFLGVFGSGGGTEQL